MVAAACGLVCAVLMLPLGFQYDGLWAIVVFFFFGSVLSRPLSLVAEALPKALYAAKMLPLWGARLCYLFLDAAATALPLAAVDLVMDSVTAPWPWPGWCWPCPGSRTSGRKSRSSGKPPPSPACFTGRPRLRRGPRRAWARRGRGRGPSISSQPSQTGGLLFYRFRSPLG